MFFNKNTLDIIVTALLHFKLAVDAGYFEMYNFFMIEPVCSLDVLFYILCQIIEQRKGR